MVTPPRVPHVPLRRRVHRPPAVNLHVAHELHVAALRGANRATQTVYWHEVACERFERWVRETDRLPEATEVDVGALDPAHVRSFVAWLREGYESVNHLTGRRSKLSAKTVHDYTMALKSLSRWLLSEGLIPRDLLANLQLPRYVKRVVPVFTEAQVHLLRDAIEHRPNRTRNLALLYLLLGSGARISEVLSLTWGEIDFKERRARVTGKGKKQRWIYFDGATGRLLMRLQTEQGAGTGRVFLSKDRAALSYSAARSLFAGWGDEAGIPECHPHMLRHTFATNFLSIHPGAVLQLQELLGHTDVAMVRRYVSFVEGTAPVSGPSVIQHLHLDRVSRYLSAAAALAFEWWILRNLDSILGVPGDWWRLG
jgi:site-specific recombinase XerD